MKTAWIVAGGPSLRRVDLSLLAGRWVISVNRAHELIFRPERHDVWWTDFRFWSHYQSELLLRAVKGAKLHSMIDPAGRHTAYPTDLVNVWAPTGLTGLDLAPGCLRHGNNGGYTAINLAAQLGTRRIVLLGYDMALGYDGAGHWHKEYPWGAMRERTLREKMLPFFSTLVQPLHDLGIEVLNATVGSHLDVFPKIDFEEALSKEETM